MIQVSTPPTTTNSMSTRSSSARRFKSEDDAPTSEDQVSDAENDEDEDDDDDDKDGKRSRRELPAGAVATLKAWLLSPEHFTHPYPTPQDQTMLMQKTGIDKKQLKNWFTNARRRIWKPMLKKQLEQGKISQTSGGNVVLGGTSGLIASASTVSSLGASFDNNIKAAAGGKLSPNVAPSQNLPLYQNQYNNNYLSSQQHNNSLQKHNHGSAMDILAQSSSLGSLPLYAHGTTTDSSNCLNKSDSHAVLMELFVRDQDLVRQYTEGMKLRATAATASAPSGNIFNQNGTLTKGASTAITNSRLNTTSSVNSWPHFSSVSSLNNLGSMTGVKSITNMSGADLAGLGSLNKKGNLAQVKSMESMGNADSYAFLEVFFDNPGVSSGRGIKREREDDDNIGLSLDGDESSPGTSFQTTHPTSSSSVSLSCAAQASREGLRQAFEEARAARGLISVSRSCEKLSELPLKMQRSLSQEYIKSGSLSFSSSFNYSKTTTPDFNEDTFVTPLSDPSSTSASVEVPSTTKCTLCNGINVDTQLRPCGHMFHGRCLKPSLQKALGAPRCPCDGIAMQSAVLAIPTDEDQRNDIVPLKVQSISPPMMKSESLQ